MLRTLVSLKVFMLDWSSKRTQFSSSFMLSSWVLERCPVIRAYRCCLLGTEMMHLVMREMRGCVRE